MKTLAASILVLACGAALPAQSYATRTDTVHVADRYLFDTTTMGAEVIAKFGSAAVLMRELALDLHVAEYGKRRWTLRDILVTIDFNGNGDVARWTVAGPRSVVDAHLAHIRELALNRSYIYDHGIRRRIVLCACD
jgi:hypothetical protein